MKYSKIIVLLIAGCCSLVALADNHADKPKALPMALWSTYEIPVGAKPSEIEASLVAYLEAEEKRGFNNCASPARVLHMAFGGANRMVWNEAFV